MGPQDRACSAPCRQGDWRSCLQAVQDPRGQEVYRSRLHCDAPEAKGELEEVLQGQEIQAPGPPPKEDQGYPQGSLRPRKVSEDPQDSACPQVLPSEEVCCESVICILS